MSHGPPHRHATGLVADASVRLARPGDAPAVGVVQAAVWRDAYAGVLAPEVVATFDPASFASRWRASLEDPPSPAHRLLVACAGEQVVGFSAVGPSPDRDAADGDGELLTLEVHPDARRQGHGSRLLNAAVDMARDAGLRSLRGWLLVEAEAARSFLVAGGFAPDGAYRDRVVGADGRVAREVRLTTDLTLTHPDSSAAQRRTSE